MVITVEYCDNASGDVADTILSVVDTGRADDTYCFTEPLKNVGVSMAFLSTQ